jgi:hypothetical protein
MTDSEAQEAVEALRAIRAANTLMKLAEIERRVKGQPYARHIATALEDKKALLRRRNGQ